MISAACTFEFTPEGGDAITLLEAGGWMTSMPRFATRQGVLEPDGIGREDGFLRALGGALTDVTFTSAAWPESGAEMWAGFLGTLPESDTGVLTMTGGGKVTTFAPAVMQDTAPALPGPDGVLVKTWRFLCALPTTEEI